MRQFDPNKSLQQLDGQDWGEPKYDSHLVTECHRLHRVPLRDFSVEDLRIMIGQHFGMQYLVPLALEQLRADPLVEGAFHPGDLLAVVLRAGSAFWQQHPELRGEVAAIAKRAVSSPADAEILREAYDQFHNEQTTSL
jgi:hypothetical protein